MSCEHCHRYPHHPRCPNALEPKVLDFCKQCGDDLIEEYGYYVDNEENKFCSKDCAVEYHGIVFKY